MVGWDPRVSYPRKNVSSRPLSNESFLPQREFVRRRNHCLRAFGLAAPGTSAPAGPQIQWGGKAALRSSFPAIAQGKKRQRDAPPFNPPAMDCAAEG